VTNVEERTNRTINQKTVNPEALKQREVDRMFKILISTIAGGLAIGFMLGMALLQLPVVVFF